MADTPPLTLYYVNINPLSTSPNPTLPLLTTLRPKDQTSITRFLHLPDRQMSLASTLLKHLFIHRTAKVPWSEIVISRTAAPHQRPFWDPSTAPSHLSNPRPGAAEAVEFNVSHQAGLVVLAGCTTSSPPSTVTPTADGALVAPSSSDPHPARRPDPNTSPRIGIDVTCVSEPSRRATQITTPAQFSDWVDIFSEVFSPTEIKDLKSYQPTPVPKPASSLPSLSPSRAEVMGLNADLVPSRLRHFYTCWALKEAYIKMTGEALLAGWLRELEFGNVRVPGAGAEDRWGKVEGGVEVWLRGVRVQGLRVEVVGFGREFVVAMVGRGLDLDGQGQGALLGAGLREVDIERDVRACAEGRCGCLDGGGG